MKGKPQILRIPKVQLAVLLVLVLLSALAVYPRLTNLVVVGIAVTSTVLCDVLLTYVGKKVWFPPYAAVVTGLIIGLIIDPHAPWYSIAMIGAIAVASKQFLRTNNGHIFNPAAFGLVLGGIILQQSVSWWGVSFQHLLTGDTLTIVSFLILLLPLTISAVRLKRLGSIGSFLLFFAILSYIATSDSTRSLQTFFLTLIDPTVLFFALVMLPEPRTSPSDLRRQVFYGAVVAIVATILGTPSVGQTLVSWGLLPDQLLVALLVGNALFFI